MARPEAEEISPMIIATLSRSINLSALAEAVCGLTESSITSSILRHHTAGIVDLLGSELYSHHRIFAERPEKAGERSEMSDADRIGLPAHDRRHADPGQHRGAGRVFDERAA